MARTWRLLPKEYGNWNVIDVAEIRAIEQSLLNHFGDIKDQAASDLCQK
ncbi:MULTISPECIES: hypothetical protein [unclassified Microcoleus]